MIEPHFPRGFGTTWAENWGKDRSVTDDSYVVGKWQVLFF